jgi:hypothetical protein
MLEKMIQISVPATVHRSIKARAAVLPMTMSDYLLEEMQEMLERPTLLELRQRLHRRRPVKVQIDTAQLVRAAQREPKPDPEDFGEDL